MSIRISDSYVSRLLVGDMNRSLSQLLDQQRMASTLQRVNSYADDPRAVASIARLNDLIDANTGYLDNVGRSRVLVDGMDAALQDLSGILADLKVIALRESSGSASSQTMAATLPEAEALRGRMLEILNTSVEGQYLFAGHMTDTAPFIDAGGTVMYRGDSGEISAATGPHSSLVVNIPGDVFNQAGGYFTAVEDLAAALTSGDTAAVLAVVGSIDQLEAHLGTLMVKVGGRQNDLDWAADTLVARDERLRESLSNEQDADVARVATDLSRAEAAYQASLMVTSKLFEFNLMDFLR